MTTEHLLKNLAITYTRYKENVIEANVKTSPEEYQRILNEDLPIDVENSFKECLHAYPHDTELWLQYAIFLFGPPLADTHEAIECINTVLTYDKNNAHGILLLAFFNEFSCGFFDKAVFAQLSSIHNQPYDVMAMVQLAKAWYYEYTDPEKYKEFLLHSISYDNNQVNNYDELATYYFYRNSKEAEKLIRIGLTNIQYLYTKKDFFNTNLRNSTEFFNERFKGIYKTTPNQESMVEMLEKLIVMNATPQAKQ